MDSKFNFLQVSKDADLIIQAKIVGFQNFDSTKVLQPPSMKVEIIEQIAGTINSKQITILGSGTNDCYDWLYNYKPGQTFIFSLLHINKNIDSVMYVLPVCGHHSLIKKGNTVTGVISKQMSNSFLKNYRKLLEKSLKIPYGEKNESKRKEVRSKIEAMELEMSESISYTALKKLLTK
jgi:hypothetical protein